RHRPDIRQAGLRRGDDASRPRHRRRATEPREYGRRRSHAAGRGVVSLPLREASEPETTDVLARLGVRTVINAFETMSSVGGSKSRPEALEAMRRAAGSFVLLNELNAKVGERIAALTRNEGAVVTNGALAGMLLATAACIARRNPGHDHPLVMPLTAQNVEVIVQRCQYSPYVPNITQVGARIVEIGYGQQRTP